MKRLYARNSYLGLRLTVLIILSIVLMSLDHRDNYFTKVRSYLTLIVTPMQYAVDWPMRAVATVKYSISSRQALIDENTQLRYEQLTLKAKLQKLLALERENDQLRALLKSTPLIADKVMAAQLLSIDASPYNRIITLDKGKLNGVYTGQPVLDAHGIMGQVIHVNRNTCLVLLVTDTKSAVPVQVNRTGDRAILVGTDGDTLLLNNLPKTADIQEGDLLVTSGLDHRFPEGYPIGTVSKVNSKPGEMFVSVTVTPAAHLNRSKVVLLLSSRNTEL